MEFGFLANALFQKLLQLVDNQHVNSVSSGTKILVQDCKEPRHNNVKVGSSNNLGHLWANRWREGVKSCAQDR